MSSTGNFLELNNIFPLKFVICFSSLGSCPGADALMIPSEALDRDETMCFGPLVVVVHFYFIFSFVLDQVGWNRIPVLEFPWQFTVGTNPLGKWYTTKQR